MPAFVNIAVLGLGRMGTIYAQTLARQIPLAKLYAVADPDAQARAELLARIKRRFNTVKHAKPPASRKQSAETYVVAQGFKG